jgi:cytochrome P450
MSSAKFESDSEQDTHTAGFAERVRANQQKLTAELEPHKALTSTLDPYADEALLKPWPLYTELREMGPVVWLEKYGMFALTRYDAVAKALRDWQAFPSSFGVMMNDDMNQLLRGNTLCSDGIAHKQLRQVVMRPITPAALASLDYMGPSLDTTVFGISSGVWLFANHPDQWDLVRNDPSLIPAAINEILRMEAPIQDFSRYVARDYDLDGVSLPEGSRAIIFYGAANRDPRQFPDPDRFDVRRDNAGRHMAFGAGPHACLGMNLARLEMRALFTALARKVTRFHVEVEERALNNILRGFSKLIVTVE